MKIAAASKSNVAPMPQQRTDLHNYASTDPAWTYIEFDNSHDLLTELQNTAHEPLEVLEIMANGGPSKLDSLSSSNVGEFGNALMGMAVFQPTTEIYLSGCNTGLDQSDGYGPLPCISHRLSEFVNSPVLGSCGYLTGSHAARTESVVENTPYEGAFDGAITAQGNACWKKFQGGAVRNMAAAVSGMHISISTPRMAMHLTDVRSANLERILVRTMKGKSGRDPGLYRVAPDATIWIGGPATGKRLELIRNGSYLRDPDAGKVWRFKDMPVVERLVRKHVRLKF